MGDSDTLGTNLRRLGPILDTALDAVVVMRADGRVAGWNAVAEATFGWSRAEALGTSMGKLIVPPQYRAAHAEGLRRFLSTGERHVLGRRIEITALRKTGEEFPVELSISRTDGDGEELFVGFLRDISERRRAERSLARQAQEAQLLFNIAQFASEAESLDAVFGATLEAICSLTGWPVGHVLVRGGEAADELVSTGI